MNRPFLAVVAAATVLSGCEELVRTNPLDPSYPMTVTLSGPDSIFSINDTIQFQLATQPDHPDLPFAWTSSNTGVLAPVPNAPGRFSALANGTATVTATYGPRVVEQQVVVSQKPVSLAILPPPTTSFASFGEEKILTAAIVDARGVPVSTALDSLEWTSSNPGILTVVEGEVTAVGNGTAWIRAEAQGQRDSVQLHVQQVPASVEFNDDEYEILIPGGSVQATVLVGDAGGTPIANPVGLALSTSRPGFTISPAGLVSSAAWGSAVLTATIDGLVATASVRVIGGTAPLVSRAFGASLALDRPAVPRVLVAELTARDAEADLEDAVVEVYSNIGNWITTRLQTLPQGATDVEFWNVFPAVAGAGTVQTRLTDAGGNTSLLSIVPVQAQPGAGSPNAQIDEFALLPNRVEATVLLTKFAADLRSLYLFGFTEDNVLVASETLRLGPGITEAVIGLDLPAGASVQYIGVAVSDESGNFSMIRTIDIQPPQANLGGDGSGALAFGPARSSWPGTTSLVGGAR